MRRAIPLVKIVLRMLIFGLILGAALGLLTIVAFGSTFYAPKSFYYQQAMQGEVINGAILGALIGLALAMYSCVAHRTIHKPHLFKFALLIVATIVTLAVEQGPFHIMVFAELGTELPNFLDWMLRSENFGMIAVFVGTIAKHVAVGLMSLYVAGRYLREASAQYLKSTGQTPA